MSEEKQGVKPNQLAKINRSEHGIILTTLDDLRTFSQIAFASKLAPEGYKSIEQVFIGIQAGAEIGLKPLQALQNICVIHGKPTVWGDAALGLVKNSGLLVDIEETLVGTGNDMVAYCKTWRKGQDKPVATEFSVDDAITADLWTKKGPWKTHPKRMLKYKARAFNLRDNFPDVLMGMHLTEEMYGEEQLPALPVSETKPRHERRKVVATVSSKEEPPSPDTDVESEVTGGGIIEADLTVKGEDIKAETMAPAAGFSEMNVDTETGEVNPVTYDEVVELFEASDHGNCGFAEFAAFTLCLEDEEVATAGQFTVDMLEHLQRELQTNGVPDELKGE